MADPQWWSSAPMVAPPPPPPGTSGADWWKQHQDVLAPMLPGVQPAPQAPAAPADQPPLHPVIASLMGASPSANPSSLNLGALAKQAAYGVPEGVLDIGDIMGNLPGAGSMIGRAGAAVDRYLLGKLPPSLNPDQNPPQNLPERLARAGGRALPWAATMQPEGVLGTLENVGSQIAGGVGSEALQEAAPESLQRPAAILGSLAGQPRALLAARRPGALLSTFKNDNALIPDEELPGSSPVPPEPLAVAEPATAKAPGEAPPAAPPGPPAAPPLAPGTPPPGGAAPPPPAPPIVPPGGVGPGGLPPGSTGAAMVRALPDDAKASLKAAVEREGITDQNLPQKEAEIGDHQFFGEVGPSLQADMGAIASIPGEAKAVISKAVGTRALEAPQRIEQALTATLGPRVNLAQMTHDLDQARNSPQVQQAYDAWRQTPVTPWQGLYEGQNGQASLWSRLQAAGAVQGANKKMAIAGLPATQQFDLLGSGNAVRVNPNITTSPQRMAQRNVVGAPTAQSFDYMKRDLDGKISDALAREGGGDDARLYGQLKNDLVTAIDNHPDPRVAGVWKQGRQLVADPASLQDAVKLGQRLFTAHVDPEDIPFLTSGFSDPQVRALQATARTQMSRIMDASRRGDASLRNKFLAEGGKEKLRWIFGDQRANNVIDMLEHEDAYAKTPQAVLGGSPTQPRLEAAKNWNPPEKGFGETLHEIVHGGGPAAALVGHLAGLEPHTALALGAAVGGTKFVRKAQAEKAMAGVRNAVAPIFALKGEEAKGALREIVGTKVQGSPPTAQPLARTVLQRGRDGRPIQTVPLPIGGEQRILNAAATRSSVGRVLPSGKIIGGGRLGDPLGPADLAEDIWQTNRGKLKSSLAQLGRMRANIARTPYLPKELDEAEVHLNNLATKPFVSQADKDAAAEAALDAAEKSVGDEAPAGRINFQSAGARRRR